MAEPGSVPACIKALSSTTFVAEVKAPALAVLVPLLQRALNDRSMEVQRRTVIVIDNLVKLVRDPRVAAKYLSPLLEGVEKIAHGASFPEVCDNLLYLVFSCLSRANRFGLLDKQHLIRFLNPGLQHLDLPQSIATSTRKSKMSLSQCIPYCQKNFLLPPRVLLMHRARLNIPFWRQL